VTVPNHLTPPPHYDAGDVQRGRLHVHGRRPGAEQVSCAYSLAQGVAWGMDTDIAQGVAWGMECFPRGARKLRATARDFAGMALQRSRR